MARKRATKERLVNTREVFKSPVKRSLYRVIQPAMEQLLGVRKLNKFYDQVKKGPQEEGLVRFAEEVFRVMEVQFEISDEELEPLRKHQGPLVILANHPFGGMEALALMILMGRIRPDFKVMANFLLGAVEEVRDHLIMVDPFDEQDSKVRNVGPLKASLAYLKKGGLMGIFPSGEVAALSLKERRIREPDWNPNIARLIQKTGAAVVPLFFKGRNSNLFQLAGVVSPKLRTPLLVREFVRLRGKPITYTLGSLIPPETIAGYKTPAELTQYLQSKIFLLSLRYPRRKRGIILKPLSPGAKKAELQEAVAEPENPEPLLHELALLPPSQFLLEQGDFNVILFRAEQAPHLLREVGRVREVTFRAVGEGTGDALDLGEYDLIYDQLIIWDRTRKAVVGGYRLAKVDEMLANYGESGLYTLTSFKIQPAFFEAIPKAIECSRAFVAPEYQRSFAPLMLLWSGIGRYIVQNPSYTHLLGCLSVSNEFHQASQNFLVQYLSEFNLDTELAPHVEPYVPFPFQPKLIEAHYKPRNIESLADVQELISDVEERDMKIPVLLRQYLRLGSKSVGFNIDPNFSNVLDVLIHTDLRTANPTTMAKYLGDAGYAAYRAAHQLPPLAQGAD